MSNNDKSTNEVEAIWENKSFRIKTFKTVLVLSFAAIAVSIAWILKAL